MFLNNQSYVRNSNTAIHLDQAKCVAVFEYLYNFDCIRLIKSTISTEEFLLSISKRMPCLITHPHARTRKRACELKHLTQNARYFHFK